MAAVVAAVVGHELNPRIAAPVSRRAQDNTNAGGRDKAPGQLYGLLTHKTENVITFAAGNVDSDAGSGSGSNGAFEIRFNIVNCVQNFVI